MPIKLVFTCNATQDEEIIIVGSHGCLGEWILSAGLRLSGFPHAYGSCYIEKPTKIEFKAMRKKGSTSEWELADLNRIVNVKVIPTLYIDFEFNDPSIRLLVHISYRILSFNGSANQAYHKILQSQA
jgi:Starch binding domain